MTEREHARRHHEPRHDDVDVATPGRASTTSTLTRSAQARASGLVLRKGEGDISVDAERAVASAATGTGHALPDELRARFESSLGTDLSAVRVHTGAESHAAAKSVSARAYAIGNDIHFGAGHYDPSSTGGQHLIAHEVAHTVQQRGGAVRQHKLEVSHAKDAHEVDADRAADAMVTGAPAQLTAIDGGVVQRDPEKPAAQPLPAPISWDGLLIDGDIDVPWSGAPWFPAQQQVQSERAGACTKAFTAAWKEGQAIWNDAVPAMREYKDASRDAEHKGFADFGGKGTDIDIDAQQEDFGTKSTVGDASFGKDKAVAGTQTYDVKKLDEATRRKVSEQKVAVKTARDALESSETVVENKQYALSSANHLLQGAQNTLKVKADAKGIKQAAISIDNCKRAATAINTAIGSVASLAKAIPKPEDALVAGLQMLNTVAWEVQIQNCESELRALDIDAANQEIEGAAHLKAVANNNVQVAVNEVRLAITAYTTNARAYKKAYAELAATLGQAAAKSSGNAKQGEKVKVAVEAIPLMELTIEKCKALLPKLRVVFQTEDAGIGGALCGNSGDFTRRMGILAQWREATAASQTKWEKRLQEAKKLASVDP